MKKEIMTTNVKFCLKVSPKGFFTFSTSLLLSRSLVVGIGSCRLVVLLLLLRISGCWLRTLVVPPLLLSILLVASFVLPASRSPLVPPVLVALGRSPRLPCLLLPSSRCSPCSSIGLLGWCPLLPACCIPGPLALGNLLSPVGILGGFPLLPLLVGWHDDKV